MKDMILASASPRRKELLSLLGVEFDVIVSECEEVVTSTDPAKVVMDLSMQKAEAVVRKVEKGKVIIGADTVVSFNGKIMGKPLNSEEAYQMINLLQGQTHQVYTGVTIFFRELGHCKSFCEKTDVVVASMDEDEIWAYICTDEPYDKAGAYGIQGLFSKFVEGIIGDYSNVVGLPVRCLYAELRKEKVL